MTMRRPNLPWRFLFPGIVFPASLIFWVRYHMSVRAFDDSPGPWYWYGSPISAALNFPAYAYSGLANLLDRMGVPGFKVGRLWIHPQVLAFFVLIIVHWYWIGWKVEHWGQPIQSPPPKARYALIALYGVGAAYWFLWLVATVNDSMQAVFWPPRAIFLGLYIDRLIRLLWSVALSAYYSTSFVRSLRIRH